MIHFVMEVGKNLATVIGKTKIMLRGNHLATRATETLRVKYCDCKAWVVVTIVLSSDRWCIGPTRCFIFSGRV